MILQASAQYQFYVNLKYTATRFDIAATIGMVKIPDHPCTHYVPRYPDQMRVLIEQATEVTARHLVNAHQSCTWM